MSEIYTTQWWSVNDADVTSHTPKDMVDGDIEILSSEIQWEGVSVTEQDYTYSSNWDKDSVYAATVSATFPSIPSGYNFDRHNGYVASAINWADHEVDYEVEIDTVDGTIETDSGTLKANSGHGIHYFNDDYTNHVGESITISPVQIDVDTKLELELQTRGVKEDGTTTYQTKEPSVSGDASGSLTGTLTDGEQSTWQTLTNLGPNQEDLTHGISESNKARFRFEFEYEYLIPDPVNGRASFYDNSAGVWKECAIADPADSSLDYNHVRIYNSSTGSWGALDVVDPSDSDAISSMKFYDADVGWLAPRKYSSTSG